ncbi:hypothetical protein LTR10_009595 [Elasticomyces elasticus]|nr:hypothetical protein LTR10_009595 [Elasticomyces elasticus]KAK4971310.1 hypothetical protein LTR42_007036 [Elasticomyces elasticus]
MATDTSGLVTQKEMSVMDKKTAKAPNNFSKQANRAGMPSPHHSDQQVTNAIAGAANHPNSTLSAGARTSGITELLEQILLDDDLSMQDVLLAQRTSRHFLLVITGSKPLQQKLFLAPRDAKHAHSDILINPLLNQASVRRRLPFFIRRLPVPVVERQGNGSQRLSAQIATQFAADLERHPTRVESQAMERDIVYVTLELVSPHGFRETTAADYSTLPAGSWSRMYLSQPPLPVYCSVDVFYQRGGDSSFHGWARVKDTCTLDELLGAVSEQKLQYTYRASGRSVTRTARS